MSKSIFTKMLVIGLLLASLSFFIQVANPICNYSNSMSQEEMAADPGYQHGYPFHYLSDDEWHCNEAGETGRGFRMEGKLTPVANFLGDWFVWFSVSFTVYSLYKGERKKR